jgi:hypothetical protein
MRLTDYILLALLGLALYGAIDPAAASDLLGHLVDHLRAALPFL